MASSVVRTGSEPETDHMELNLVVWFQVQHTPLNLTSVRFEVLSFQSKTQTEPDYYNPSHLPQPKRAVKMRMIMGKVKTTTKMTIKMIHLAYWKLIRSNQPDLVMCFIQ